MNNLDEIKKRLAYVKSNNLFDAHYINDMNWLIEKNKKYLESCVTFTEVSDLRDQAIIDVSIELNEFMKFTFDPDEVEYKKLKVLIETVMSIPGIGLKFSPQAIAATE